MLTFEYPYFLLLIIIFISFSIWLKPRYKAMIFPHLHLISSPSLSKNIIIPILKWLSIIFIIIALASPIKENVITQKGEGYNICLILDASLSMGERGFNRFNLTQTRFDVVQEIVSNFIKKRINDNLSIVVFGDFSFVALPLSFDKKMASSILSTLKIGMAGRQTAIYDSIVQSINSLDAQKAKKKIAILLTDGQNTAGEIPYNVAIRMAKEHKIKIYTIGIGAKGEFDMSSLIDISKQTKGKFFQASNSNSLKEIYKQIDTLEKYEIKSSTFTQKDYYYQYPLFLSILFLIFYLLLINKKSIV